MFLVIHHVGSSYICFKEAEVTEATTVFPKNILVIFITSIISIPNSKPEVCKYSPHPQYSLKSLRASLQMGIEPVISERTMTYVLSAHTTHMESRLKKWKFNNLNR